MGARRKLKSASVKVMQMEFLVYMLNFETLNVHTYVCSLFFNFCRSFENPTISNDERRNGEDALGLGILKHLRMKHGDSDSSTTVEMRMDVFRHILEGKEGSVDERAGMSLSLRISPNAAYLFNGKSGLTTWVMARK